MSYDLKRVHAPRRWADQRSPAGSVSSWRRTHAAISGGWGSNLGAGGGGLGAEFDVPKCAEGMMGCRKG